MVHVLIVSDCPLFRIGIRSALTRTGDYQVIGESTDPVEVLDIVRTRRPDVVLLDGDLISADPLEMARMVHQQQASSIGGIFVFAPSESNDDLLFHFVRCGAAAYEERSLTPQELVDKVRKVSLGEFLIDGDLLGPSSPLYHSSTLRARDSIDIPLDDGAIPASTLPLSSREREILELIASGKSNKEIGRTLEISDQTVKNHITSILKKLHVSDRTAAVVYALREKWIKLEDM